MDRILVYRKRRSCSRLSRNQEQALQAPRQSMQSGSNSTPFGFFSQSFYFSQRCEFDAPCDTASTLPFLCYGSQVRSRRRSTYLRSSPGKSVHHGIFPSMVALSAWEHYGECGQGVCKWPVMCAQACGYMTDPYHNSVSL